MSDESIPFTGFPFLRAGMQSAASSGLQDLAGNPIGRNHQFDLPERQLFERARISSRSSAISLFKDIPHGWRHAMADIDGAIRGLDATVGNGIDQLSRELDIGFGTLARLSAQNQRTLSSIEEVLRRPLETAALERRERGLRGYKNGLIEEAEADLLSAVEQNPYDMIAWIHLGHISLRCQRFAEADERYQRASRYATAENVGFIHGFSLLGSARALSALNRSNGRSEIAQAVAVIGDRWEAHYELARIESSHDPSAGLDALVDAASLAPKIIPGLAAADGFFDDDRWDPAAFFAALEGRVDQVVDQLARDFGRLYRRPIDQAPGGFYRRLGDVSTSLEDALIATQAEIASLARDRETQQQKMLDRDAQYRAEAQSSAESAARGQKWQVRGVSYLVGWAILFAIGVTLDQTNSPAEILFLSGFNATWTTGPIVHFAFVSRLMKSPEEAAEDARASHQGRTIDDAGGETEAELARLNALVEHGQAIRTAWPLLARS